MVSQTKKSQNKIKNANPTLVAKKKRGLLLIFFVFIAAVFYFLFFMNTEKTPEHLKGSWLRVDGSYTIEISEVQKEGKLIAKYFNPNPINVGSSGWRLNNKRVELFVELDDENYPGSLYKLYFNKKTETLEGTYYQAVAKQTFNVSFKKKI